LPPTRGVDSPNLTSTASTLPLFRRTGAKLFLSFFYGGGVVC
jgi:hypothetical protein